MKYTVTCNHGEYAVGIFDSYEDAAYKWYMLVREDEPEYIDWVIEDWTKDLGEVPTPVDLYEESDSEYGILEVRV